jgi:hypothetical protein
MKLNENGDFCLLYIEPADDKQRLFELIGEQKKPVVLMLPLMPGQARSRLFQRPEDFSDLKYVRRQTNVSIIFLTSGSEQLAQLAARYGFPAYPSIDVFAETLAHGRRAELEEKEQRGHMYAPRRSSTGPLTPSALPIASIRRSLQTAPLHAPTETLPWPTPASAAFSGPPNERRTPLPATPLHPPTDFAFSPAFKQDVPFVEQQPRRSPVTGRLSLERDNGFSPSFAPERETPPPHVGSVSSASRLSEIPPRRSAMPFNGQAAHRPEWEPEEYTSDRAHQAVQDRLPAASPMSRAASHSLSELPTQPPPVQPPVPPRNKHARRGFSILLIILVLLVLGGAGLGSLIVSSHSTPAAPVALQVGSLAFFSTGQINTTTSDGIDDQVQLTLHDIGTPAANKSYYAWLLGELNVVNGSATVLYTGDAQNTNLLQITSRFLVTEEDSNITPVLPSPDISNWRYYGALAATPDPNSTPHYSYLNHLRHLLADEPILDQMELPGGLSNWFTRNTEELITLTSGARDQWQNAQNTQSLTAVQDQAIRVLSYLDGMSFLYLDIPPALASRRVSLDTRMAGLGLLNVRGVGQNPPSYMDQFAFHLNGLVNAPGAPATIRNSVTPISSALSNVQVRLQNLRSDAKQLLAMTLTQLGQPGALSILNDMVIQASNAYTGGSDPSTGQFEPGVVWIQQHLQSLATISISAYNPGASVPEIGPSTQNPSSFVLPLLAAWQEGL